MSLNTPPNDDSDSNQDWSGNSSLIQRQNTYHRFLASLLAYSRAAYDAVQLPSSGGGYANKIAPLSTVFPGLYPFETLNPISFDTRPLECLDRADDPSASSVEEQDTSEPGSLKDTQTAPHNTDPSLSLTSRMTMFHNARNFRIEGRPEFTNMVIRCGDNSLLSFLIIIVAIAFACLIPIFGGHYGSPTANLSTDIQVYQPHTSTSDYVTSWDIRHGLGDLEPFVSREAINGSFLEDAKRQVYPGTRERVLNQIKVWIDNPNATERILWLHGPAGVGKSAIAQTITQSYTTEKIPANFFFFHSDSRRNNGNRLFTTLAWKFASSIPAIKSHIADSLKNDPDLGTKNVETQFQDLVVRPFEALRNDTRQPQLLDMVVVIDGVDECLDAGIQERILKVIGNIAANTRVPLRFLISSRPEAHINETINRFKCHTLSIDLDQCADANRDIEKYLKDGFEDIAKGQDIDPAIWPGQGVIQQFVGDEENSAKTQLDVIMGLKPRTTMQPFAELDRLYTEIMERQSDQEFLKTFLALLVAHNLIYRHFPRPFLPPPATPLETISIPTPLPSSPPAPSTSTPPRPPLPAVSHYRLHPSCFYQHLRGGYGILMNVSEQELRRKLRKMRSLLNDDLGYYHRSFHEFLQGPSRSGQYNISVESAMRQHLMLVIHSLVRSASLVIEQPNHRPPVPQTVVMLGKYASCFDRELSIEVWRDALRPLLDFQDRLLKLPNFTLPHNECNVFNLVHRLLLRFSYHRLFLDKPEENGGAVMPSVLMQNLREGLSSLQTYLLSQKGMFDLMNTLRHINPDVIAMKVHSWAEAQNLMDLIDYIVNGKYILTSLFSTDAARKATQLAFEIHTRVPVLPQSLHSETHVVGSYSVLFRCQTCDIETLSRVQLFSKFLDHRYIIPMLGSKVISKVDGNMHPLSSWQGSTNASSNAIISIMLNLARAIQYLQSMGIKLISIDDIYVDSRFHVRVSPTELALPIFGRSSQKIDQRYESNIHNFGYIFCAMYFNSKYNCIPPTGMSPDEESSIRGDVWRLIDRCIYGKNKPTIDEVIQEMESWKVGL